MPCSKRPPIEAALSLFWFGFRGLICGSDLSPNILRFFGQSQFPEARHLRADIGRLFVDHFRLGALAHWHLRTASGRTVRQNQRGPLRERNGPL